MIELTLDFESFYSSKLKYSLKNLSIVEYVNDPRFEVLGVGVQVDGGSVSWVPAAQIPAFFSKINWADTIVIAHNVRFDGAILAWKYGVKPARWVDTQALAMASYGATIPKVSLAALAERFGFPEKGVLKSDGKHARDFTTDEWLALGDYCRHDVELCRMIYDKLKANLSEPQYRILDWTVRAFLEPHLVLDRELAARVGQEITEERERRIAALGIDKAILSSNPKFAEYLKSQGYEVPLKKNKKGDTIPALAAGDSGFIAMLYGEDEQLKLICQARMAAKQTMAAKRAEKLAVLNAGGLYPFDVRFSGAKQTHRFSGGDGAGGNPQNFPARKKANGSEAALKLRECIRAPEGSLLLVSDFDKIELRALAHLAGDIKLIADIANDPYSIFASRIYGRPITKKDNPAERQLGKCAVLGLGYSMGPKRFAEQVRAETGEVIKKEFAWEIVRLYRSTYPFVPSLWEKGDTVIKMMADGYRGPFPGVRVIQVDGPALVLPSGLRLQYPNLRFDKEREEWVYDTYKNGRPETANFYGGKLTENLCQSLAGELCKESILYLLDKGIVPSGQVHDELLTVTPLNRLNETAAVLKTAMTVAPAWWPEITLDVEIGKGDSWKQAKQTSFKVSL